MVVRAALRRVTSRCIYGLDVNPMAAELARVDMANDADRFRTRGQLERDGWTLNGNVFARAGKRTAVVRSKDDLPLRP